MTPPSVPSSSTAPLAGWLGFTAVTIACWGLYGILLHKGQVLMADPVAGRYKAFLFVGVAYFFVAVCAPAAALVVTGGGFAVTGAGASWSLFAGVLGAVGAFSVLLAFTAGGVPAQVMTLVFAGAPLVNAAVALTLSGGWADVRWPFVLGVALAITGGALVTLYR